MMRRRMRITMTVYYFNLIFNSPLPILLPPQTYFLPSFHKKLDTRRCKEKAMSVYGNDIILK